VVQEDVYDGIPVVDLPIRDVDVPDPAHLRRSERYPGAVDIAPEEAIEAALDPRALIARDPKSRSGEAVRVVGLFGGCRASACRGVAAARASASRVVAGRYGMARGPQAA
jgi:hypothetical protein